jgi:hypothetical protein
MHLLFLHLTYKNIYTTVTPRFNYPAWVTCRRFSLCNICSSAKLRMVDQFPFPRKQISEHQCAILRNSDTDKVSIPRSVKTWIRIGTSWLIHHSSSKVIPVLLCFFIPVCSFDIEILKSKQVKILPLVYSSSNQQLILFSFAKLPVSWKLHVEIWSRLNINSSFLYAARFKSIGCKDCKHIFSRSGTWKLRKTAVRVTCWWPSIVSGTECANYKAGLTSKFWINLWSKMVICLQESLLLPPWIYKEIEIVPKYEAYFPKYSCC